MRRKGQPGAGIVALAALVFLAGAVSARAGTISVNGAELTYVAGPGEANALTIYLGPTTHVLDTSAPITAGSGCVATTIPWEVTCSTGAVTTISVSAGDMDDSVQIGDAAPVPASVGGGPGNDILVGGSGDDRLEGGDGDDRVNGGGAGNDVLLGDAGNDVLWGGSGDDHLRGGDGDDELDGFLGDDRLDGGPGADLLSGGGLYAGEDTVDYGNRVGGVSVDFDDVADDGEAGEHDLVTHDVENVRGGAGDDVLIGSFGPNVFTGNGGDDTLDGGQGSDVLGGGANDDLLVSSNEADELDGGPGDDLLDAGPPLDDVLGGAFPDVLEGGTGDDTVSYAGRTARVTVDAAGDADDGERDERDTVGADVENLIGGGGNDVLAGLSGPNLLFGGGGNDTLDGGAGADTLGGGPGADVADYRARTAPLLVDLDGAAGDDGENGEGDTVEADVEGVLGGSGDDVITGNANDNVIDGGLGADTMRGTGGVDVLDYSDRRQNLSVSLDSLPNDGQRDEGDLAGDDFEVVLGGAGDDLLRAGPGTQTLRGGGGADLLDGGPGGDVLAGGEGRDRVSYHARTGSVTADLDGLADDGEAGEGDLVEPDVEELAGGGGGDVLTGNRGANVLIGGPGPDTLNGVGGDDLLLGQTGQDLLVGGGGSDALDGGPDGDTFAGGPGFDFADYSSRRASVRVSLDGRQNDGQRAEGDLLRSDVEGAVGGRGDDVFTGNGARNAFAGGPGDDSLVGRLGADGLWGETGNDTLLARDGRGDLVHGGPGRDRARVDGGADLVRAVEILF